MPLILRASFRVGAALLLTSCAHRSTSDTAPALPAPDPGFKVQRYSTVIGWPEGKRPTAPEGFEVTRYADGLRNPRWTYVLPNGDVLVAEASNTLWKVTAKR
ncbi:hypothetical protein [Corallococcus sp. AS-1-6]|uniref:hypothetical protein n=1 Tax=Corallococcus TaxID=83461 RepID=UPI00359FA0A0